MTIEEIKDAAQTAPFKPFVLHLADGRQVPVHNHDLIMFGPRGHTVIVYQPDEHWNLIDVMLVTDVEPLRSIAK
jgi:hypothetical protein